MEFLINHLCVCCCHVCCSSSPSLSFFHRLSRKTANNQFSLARRMYFILIRKRNAHGSQPAWRRSTWASSMIAHGICIASSVWKERRRSLTRRLHLVWHSHRLHKSLDSGVMCAPIRSMDWVSPRRRSLQRSVYILSYSPSHLYM